MVAFYKHDIPSWMDGTEGLTAEEYRVYHVVVMLIYLNEWPIEANERGLAGRCNMHRLTFRTALASLIKSGKLVLENGQLTNARAVAELASIEENRRNARKGGKASGASRRRRVWEKIDAPDPQPTPNLSPTPLEPRPNPPPVGRRFDGGQGEVDVRSDTGQPAKQLNLLGEAEAPLLNDRSLRDETRLEKTRHSASRPNGSQNEAQDNVSRETQTPRLVHPAPAPTPAQELFKRGKEILGNSAGGMIANLLKSQDGNYGKAMAALELAANAENPREYIGRVIKPKSALDDYPSAL